jgi:hypothetical protein
MNAETTRAASKYPAIFGIRPTGSNVTQLRLRGADRHSRERDT